jgi:hypothetical protein
MQYIQYTGEWHPVHQFIDDAGYIPEIGAVPHIVKDNDNLRVNAWNNEIAICKPGMFLAIDNFNLKGEQDDEGPARGFKVFAERPDRGEEYVWRAPE